MSRDSSMTELNGFLAKHEPVAKPRLYDIGSVLGEWRVTAFLGSGGNAEVYRVVRDADGQVAAAKVLLREDDVSKSRFRQEAALLSAQMGATFAKFYATGEIDGRLYLVTELLEPVDLPETEKEIAEYLLAVCHYFMLQMEVHGKFDEQGEQFDPSKHKLALKLRPLKAFRRKPGRGDVTVYNRNAGPKVVVSGVSSAGAGASGIVKFGEDIIVTGENLWIVSRGGEAVQDSVTIKYFSQHGKGSIQLCDFDVAVNEAGTEMVIPWAKSVAAVIAADPERLDPDKSRLLGVMVAIRSCGGSEESKQQLHRGKAYFDRWLEKYPEYEGHFEKIDWGRV